MTRGVLIAVSVLALSQWACDGERGCHHGCAVGPAGVTGPSGMLFGSGHLATQMREVGDFHGLVAQGAVRVIVEHGPRRMLEVTAEDNLMPFMQAEVIGGMLRLGPVSDSPMSRTREVVYRLSAPHLERIEAAGACVVEIGGIATDRLEVVLSGASSLQAEGVADHARLGVSGASRVHAPDLRIRTMDATLSGASYGLLRVGERLEATVTGASHLEYLGDPVVVAHSSGGGVVRRVGP